MTKQAFVRPRRANRMELTPVQRIVVGGLGGISPVLVTMATGELENVNDETSASQLVYFTGLGIRMFAFFVLGAFVVWLNDEVRGRYPVFSLGVTAPAVLAATISTQPANAADAEAAIQTNSGVEVVQMASLDYGANSAVTTDAWPSGIYFQNCSVIDGILGRKCK